MYAGHQSEHQETGKYASYAPKTNKCEDHPGIFCDWNLGEWGGHNLFVYGSNTMC